MVITQMDVSAISRALTTSLESVVALWHRQAATSPTFIPAGDECAQIAVVDQIVDVLAKRNVYPVRLAPAVEVPV